ncbi:MAG: hypothetical protein J6C90_01010 [Clostridia bacterium]|nr:hypothetical protein [Clostridia bacterium]
MKFNFWNAFSLISLAVNARIAYNNAKKDENIRKTTTAFGKRALVYIITFAVLSLGGIALIWWGVDGFVNALIFNIFKIILGGYMVLYSLILLPLALNLVIKQMKLNKKPIGWISLVLLILSVVAVIVGLILILNNGTMYKE